jgi:hypothetical protein
MSWFHNSQEFILDETKPYVGFVYLITNLQTGRKYIGQKRFYSYKRLKKGRVKIITDWYNYWGSNKELQADVARLGDLHFVRDILHICASKGEMNYLEMKEQITRDVLLKEDYYNCFIGGKIHRKHVVNISNH